MTTMTCTCCRSLVTFVTFAEARTEQCRDCQNEDHDTTHPRGWRDA